MSHTPTPWEMETDGCIKQAGTDFKYIPLASPWREGAFNDEPTAAANAAFIVKACNAHDEMLEALIEVYAEMSESGADWDEGTPRLVANAIARAEGLTP